MADKKLSIIVSVYNEEEVLIDFYREVAKSLLAIEWDYELIFVNDGSTDESRIILYNIAKDNQDVKVLHFSKNFGHEAAMIAGIDYATGDAIICMDADLQHPPEYIIDMSIKFDEGYDVINMIRMSNKSAGIIKNITSSGFYNIINLLSDMKLEKNASDFFGISKRVADVLRKNYREKLRFLRGYVQNIGFRKVNLEYTAAKRAGGKSKYSLRKLFRFSINTIMCFSNLPLKLGMYAGVFAILLGMIMTIYTIYSWARVGTPNGYASIIVLMCFMFAVLFMIVGIIGEYIGILFTELKDRPIYIIEEKMNVINYEVKEKGVKNESIS